MAHPKGGRKLVNAPQTEPGIEAIRRFVARGQPYRVEQTVPASEQGTKVFDVGDFRIDCLICADGSHTAAWETFYASSRSRSSVFALCHTNPMRQRGYKRLRRELTFVFLSAQRD